MKTESGILNGNWLVCYDAAEFAYQEILECLADAADTLIKGNIYRDHIEIVFDKQLVENTCRLTDNGICLKLTGKNPEHIRCDDSGFEEMEERPVGHSPGHPVHEKKIKDILLCFPFLMSDKRWQSIDLTASSIFLGSALKNNGFEVKTKKMQLPAADVVGDMIDFDLIDFTLFEDLLPEFKFFLKRISTGFPAGGGALLAAGGPLITLHPLQAAYHLPEINLSVRGEAEMMLPGLLKCLNENDLAGLFRYKGFLFQRPGLIVISGLGEVNRPADFTNFHFNLDFLEKTHLQNGMEINFSRGCRRGCLFCSQVQGRELRKLPLEKIEALLGEFSAALDRSGLTAEEARYARCVNINDDDVLQDIKYARQVLNLVKKCGFKLWGLQSSPVSFFDGKHDIRREMVDLICQGDVFVNGRPLIWLGSDCFLPERGKRLGKRVPAMPVIENLMGEFDLQGILNYHYWISSDPESTWQEFAREFISIYRLLEKYKTFSLIAHSPFVVPYPSTVLYRLYSKSRELRQRIKWKTRFASRRNLYILPLVERAETGFLHLNKLLRNERIAGRPGFFDSLKQKAYVDALVTLYSFLKQERIHRESIKDYEQAANLVKTEREIENCISRKL